MKFALIAALLLTGCSAEPVVPEVQSDTDRFLHRVSGLPMAESELIMLGQEIVCGGLDYGFGRVGVEDILRQSLPMTFEQRRTLYYAAVENYCPKFKSV